MVLNPEKNACCGCTACETVCPQNALEMKYDDEGFLYPCIIQDKCISCGLCSQVCAFSKKMKNGNSVSNNIPKAYVAKHNDKGVLFNSTSGGIFTALSDEIFNANGVIYGAVFNEKFEVQHIRAEIEIDRNRMRGSKYIQSNLRGVFKRVKKDLQEARQVLFVGTPCQVDGLKSFLGNQYDNIVFCDLICFGASSPYIWKDYCENLQKKHGKLRDYNFRPKAWGYNSNKTQAIFENGKECTSFDVGVYKELYYSKLIMRQSCHFCPYANLNRVSDITIGDCRNAERLFPEFGNNGASLVIVNTENGELLSEKISKKLTMYPVDIEKVMQKPLQGASEKNSQRERFWKAYRDSGFKKAVNLFYGPKYRLKLIVSKAIKGLGTCVFRKRHQRNRSD